MANEIELTELTDIEVIRQDGVAKPASGWEFIIQKSQAAKDVNAVGGIDEQPDIDGANQVLCQLYKLVEQEAREGAVGADEECDIRTLAEAISLIQMFRSNEQWSGMEDDGSGMAKSVDDGWVFKAHRKFSSDQRSSLASEGKALPDGSYPIPDEDALRRAAILARSGHGDVAAAKRLIAKRARELGVPNPLSEDTKKDAPEGVEPELPEVQPAAETEGGEDVLTKDVVAKMIADATAEIVSKAAEERDALAEELRVLKATPIPGGPVLTAPASAKKQQDRDEAVAKAAYHRRQAEITGDREIRQYHIEKAKRLESELATA